MYIVVVCSICIQIVYLIAYMQWEAMQLRGNSWAQAHLYAGSSCSKRWEETWRNHAKEKYEKGIKRQWGQNITNTMQRRMCKNNTEVGKHTERMNSQLYCFSCIASGSAEAVCRHINAWCVRWNKAQSKHMEALSMAMTANVSVMNDHVRTKPSSLRWKLLSITAETTKQCEMTCDIMWHRKKIKRVQIIG